MLCIVSTLKSYCYCCFSHSSKCYTFISWNSIISSPLPPSSFPLSSLLPPSPPPKRKNLRIPTCKPRRILTNTLMQQADTNLKSVMSTPIITTIAADLIPCKLITMKESWGVVSPLHGLEWCGITLHHTLIVLETLLKIH